MRAANPGEDQRDSRQFDLSTIDFEKLRDEFAHKVKRKACALDDIRFIVETKLQQMLAARKQREAVEKFRGKQRLAHDHDSQRETQKFLDEMATQRASSSQSWRTTVDSHT